MNPIDLINLCKDRTVWIQTHNFPDPDAMGSAFGLQKLMKAHGIEARLTHEGEIDKLSSVKMMETLGIKMNPFKEIVSEMKEEDYIILVDCQKNNGNTTDLPGDEVATIDHHPTFVEIDYKYKDVRIVGSCSTLIASYYKELGQTPCREAATALLYGLKMDTLSFSRGVTELDIDMYRYLFEYADLQVIRDLENNNMEFDDLEAYGVAIENIKVFGKVGFSYLNFECPDAMVAILSDFLLSLAEVDVVIIYAKRKGGYKFSFRSERQDVNAGKLANKAMEIWGNGGGHQTMAGGFAKKENIKFESGYLYDHVIAHMVAMLKEMYPQVL